MKDRMAYKRYWVDKTHKKHLISMMTDEHLNNTIKMLERQAEQRASTCPYPTWITGEVASDLVDQEFDRMLQDPIDYYLSETVYDFLIEERDKRRIKIGKRK